MASNNVSTGRGGAGNIGKDDTVYTDGGIVREGTEGQAAQGAEYSTGRGGAGNIPYSPRLAPADGTQQQKQQQRQKTPETSASSKRRTDDEVVPETSLRDHQSDFHTGRGGEGNVHRDKYGGHSTKEDQDRADRKAGEGLGDKIKKMFK